MRTDLLLLIGTIRLAKRDCTVHERICAERSHMYVDIFVVRILTKVMQTRIRLTSSAKVAEVGNV